MTDHARAGEPLFVLVLVVEIRKTIPEQSVEATPPWAGNGHKEVLQYVRDGWGGPPALCAFHYCCISFLVNLPNRTRFCASPCTSHYRSAGAKAQGEWTPAAHCAELSMSFKESASCRPGKRAQPAAGNLVKPR